MVLLRVRIFIGWWGTSYNGAMRYGAEHKAETHRKIVEDGSRRVRVEGMTGAAVSAVMRDAGLSHGGFYKHFASKDELLVESVGEGFREMGDSLERAAAGARGGAEWRAVVRAYLSLEYCDHPERGCPLTALAPELARVDAGMRGAIFAELLKYKGRMQPMMPGRRAADKERAFFVIFSTMIGAVEIARMLPKVEMREKVLGNARDFLLGSF